MMMKTRPSCPKLNNKTLSYQSKSNINTNNFAHTFSQQKLISISSKTISPKFSNTIFFSKSQRFFSAPKEVTHHEHKETTHDSHDSHDSHDNEHHDDHHHEEEEGPRGYYGSRKPLLPGQVRTQEGWEVSYGYGIILLAVLFVFGVSMKDDTISVYDWAQEEINGRRKSLEN